jgi:hypothetical protein
MKRLYQMKFVNIHMGVTRKLGWKRVFTFYAWNLIILFFCDFVWNSSFGFYNLLRYFEYIYIYIYIYIYYIPEHMGVSPLTWKERSISQPCLVYSLTNTCTNTQSPLLISKSYHQALLHYQKYGTFFSRFSCQRLSPFYTPNIA